MATDTNVEELKHRVKAKQRELEARLENMRADAEARKKDVPEKIEKKLNELKTTLGDGWDNMKESTVTKLNEWLKSA